jgi:hypothetical protein
MIIKIKDWSKTPGPRLSSSGKHSAEEFAGYCIKKIVDCNNTTIDFNGTFGIADSFADELACRLVKKYGIDSVQIEITSDEDCVIETFCSAIFYYISIRSEQ